MQEEELFLSFIPESREFNHNSQADDQSIAFELIRDDDENVTHADILKQVSPWKWLREHHPKLAVKLNVHGNTRQYEAVVLERIAKYEEMCRKLEAEK